MTPKTKKPRVDKLKNQAKVISSIIKDPLMTEREIAEETGLGKTTVHDHLKELPKATKSDQIEKILANDIEIVDLAQNELKNRLKTKVDEMSTRDIIASADVSAKRYTILKGEVTDKDGGLKSLKDIPTEELLAAIDDDDF